MSQSPEISDRRTRKPIVSAEKVAALRAIGARDPLARNPDDLAVCFLGRRHRMLVWALSRSLRMGRWPMEKKYPGAYWFLQARTKHHLKNLYGTLPRQVRFVEIDFNRQSLTDALRTSDFDRSRKTLFIWEGVSYYLPEDSVRRVLQGMRELSSPGSMIVFDYILTAGLAGDANLYGAKEAVQLWRDMGEPGLFGFDDADSAREFLAEVGFTVESDIDSREMERRYGIAGKDQKPGRIMECLRFLDAVVPQPG